MAGKHSEGDNSSADATKGIFDGFEGYVSRTTEDHRRVMTSGMVVLDTNVLLNLYRYTASARDEFLGLLERIARVALDSAPGHA